MELNETQNELIVKGAGFVLNSLKAQAISPTLTRNVLEGINQNIEWLDTFIKSIKNGEYCIVLEKR